MQEATNSPEPVLLDKPTITAISWPPSLFHNFFIQSYFYRCTFFLQLRYFGIDSTYCYIFAVYTSSFHKTGSSHIHIHAANSQLCVFSIPLCLNSFIVKLCHLRIKKSQFIKAYKISRHVIVSQAVKKVVTSFVHAEFRDPFSKKAQDF